MPDKPYALKHSTAPSHETSRIPDVIHPLPFRYKFLSRKMETFRLLKMCILVQRHKQKDKFLYDYSNQ